MMRIATWFGVVAILGSSGCGPQAFPKGAGATGKLGAIIEKPDLKLRLVNTIPNAYKPAHDFMHRPFDEAVLPGTLKLDDPKLQPIRTAWNELKFVQAEIDRHDLYFARIKTNHGDLVAQLGSPEAPNHVRNFIVLTKLGYYNGAPFKLDGGLAVATAKDVSDWYQLKPEYFGFDALVGGIVSPKIGAENTSGTSFGIALVDRPTIGDGATLFAGNAWNEAKPTLEKLKAALEKGEPARIESIELTPREFALFNGDRLNLPEVSPAGKRTINAEEPPLPSSAPSRTAAKPKHDHDH